MNSPGNSNATNASDDPFAPGSASSSRVPDQQAPAAPPWRFGLFSMMLAMLVFSVIGVAASQLMRAVKQGTSPKVVFVMFTLTAPVMLVTLISLARGVAMWVRSPRRTSGSRRR